MVAEDKAMPKADLLGFKDILRKNKAEVLGNLPLTQKRGLNQAIQSSFNDYLGHYPDT